MQAVMPAELHTAILDENAVFLHAGARMLALQLARQRPVRGDAAAVEQARFGQLKAPVQMLAVRRDAWLASRKNATKAGVDGNTSMRRPP
jgi:hypothetical protein